MLKKFKSFWTSADRSKYIRIFISEDFLFLLFAIISTQKKPNHFNLAIRES